MNTIAEGTMPYQTKPTLFGRMGARLVAWLNSSSVDTKLEPYRERYTYSPGMDKPDARFHAIPGAVARKREIAARKARQK